MLKSGWQDTIDWTVRIIPKLASSSVAILIVILSVLPFFIFAIQAAAMAVVVPLGVYLAISSCYAANAELGHTEDVDNVLLQLRSPQWLAFFAAAGLLGPALSQLSRVFGGEIVSAGPIAIVAVLSKLIAYPLIIIPAFLLPIVVFGLVAVWMGRLTMGSRINWFDFAKVCVTARMWKWWLLATSFLVGLSVFKHVVQLPFRSPFVVYYLSHHSVLPVSLAARVVDGLLVCTVAIVFGVMAAVLGRHYVEIERNV